MVVDRQVSPTTGQLSATLTKTIPFDYVFEFKLQGKPANNIQDVVKLQDVVEISMQGIFVAVSLGYSFVLDERKTPRSFGLSIGPPTIPDVPVLIPFFQPEVIELVAAVSTMGAFLTGPPGSDVAVLNLNNQAVVASATIGSDGTAFVTFPPLGISASLRAWNRTNNLLSEQVDLTEADSTPLVGPDPVTNRMPAAGDKTVTVYGTAGNNVQVSILDTTGTLIPIDLISPPAPLAVAPFGSGVVGRQTVPLKVNNIDRPLSAGETLFVSLITGSPPSIGLSSRFTISPPRPSNLSLRSIMDALATADVSQTSGFRFSQRFSPIFNADTPLDQVDPTILSSAFEPACGAEDVSFLYTVDVVSTGRELQNKPIHNIAGLGIANGDRPFRPLARPIAFEPRSVIRIQIEELSTLPGTLYIVLQGYKTLGTGRIPE